MKYLLLTICLLWTRAAQALPEEDWNYNKLTKLAVLQPAQRIESLAISPDQKYLAAGFEGKIQLWDSKLQQYKTLVLETNVRTETEPGLDKEDSVGSPSTKGRIALALAFSPDSKFLGAACSDGTLRQWNLDDESHIIFSDPALSKTRSPLLSHAAEVRVLRYSADGKLLASGSDDKTVKLWDAAGGALKQILDKHKYNVVAIAFSPGGTSLVTLCGRYGERAPAGGIVTRWQIATGDMEQSMTLAGFSANGAALSSDGRVAVCQPYETTFFKLWNAETGESRGDVPYSASGMAGKSVFSDYNGIFLTVRALNTKPFNEGANEWVRRPNIAKVDIWSTETMANRQKTDFNPILAKIPPVTAVAISRTAKTFAFGCNNGTIEIWAVGTK